MIALSYGGEYTVSTTGTAGNAGFVSGANQSITTQRGRVYSVYVVNKGADAYLQCFDLAVAPTLETQVAFMVVPIPGGLYGGMNWQTGRRFANGLQVRVVTANNALGNATPVPGADLFIETCWSGIP